MIKIVEKVRNFVNVFNPNKLVGYRLLDQGVELILTPSINSENPKGEGVCTMTFENLLNKDIKNIIKLCDSIMTKRLDEGKKLYQVSLRIPRDKIDLHIKSMMVDPGVMKECMEGIDIDLDSLNTIFYSISNEQRIHWKVLTLYASSYRASIDCSGSGIFKIWDEYFQRHITQTITLGE